MRPHRYWSLITVCAVCLQENALGAVICSRTDAALALGLGGGDGWLD